MYSLYRSIHLLSSKYNSTYYIIVEITGNKNEHVKTVSKVSIFCRGTTVISLKHCFNPPRHVIHQSCTGCCWHPLPLLHNDITELLDVRHMVLLHLPLEDTPHVVNSIQVWRHTWPLHHLHLQQQGKLSSWWCVWDGCYVRKQFLKGGHKLLVQNVTVRVEIHVSLNEPQLPSTSSSHAAPDHECYHHHASLSARHNFLGTPHQGIATHAGHHLSVVDGVVFFFLLSLSV